MDYDIEKLLQVKEELNIETERINEKIKQFELDLAKLAIGIGCWVKLTEFTSLGYTKFEGRWQIVIKYEEFSKTKVTPLLKSSRTLRLYGAKYLKELLPMIEMNAKSIVEEMKKVNE